MSTYTRYLYDVYKDGELIGKRLRPIEAAKLARCEQSMINNYSKTGSLHHGKNGHLFSFKIAQTNIINKSEKIIKEKESDTVMSEEWIIGWNNMRAAATMIVLGYGKIVTMNGKKITVMV